MKTLALLYPGCIEFEIMLACEIMNQKFPIDVVTPDGLDHRGSNGMVFKASRSIAGANPNDYKAALIPGGDPGILIGNERLNNLLECLNANGAILAAICAGPIVLEQAGLLNGQKIAHGYKGPQLKFLSENGFFKETHLTDRAIIVNGNIVTARPDSFIDFAVEVAVLSGTVDPEKATFWKQYYRGSPWGSNQASEGVG